MSKQPYLSDDLAPPHNADIETAIDAWLEAKHEQKNAGEATKIKHAALLLHMKTAGIDAYPYVDPSTGKKKQVVVAREPKAKLAPAPKKNRRNQDVEVGDEVKPKRGKDNENTVESRRVKRSQVKNADAIVDPFGATRAGMSDKDTIQ